MSQYADSWTSPPSGGAWKSTIVNGDGVPDCMRFYRKRSADIVIRYVRGLEASRDPNRLAAIVGILLVTLGQIFGCIYLDPANDASYQVYRSAIEGVIYPNHANPNPNNRHRHAALKRLRALHWIRAVMRSMCQSLAIPSGMMDYENHERSRVKAFDEGDADVTEIIRTMRDPRDTAFYTTAYKHSEQSTYSGILLVILFTVVFYLLYCSMIRLIVDFMVDFRSSLITIFSIVSDPTVLLRSIGSLSIHIDLYQLMFVVPFRTFCVSVIMSLTTICVAVFYGYAIVAMRFSKWTTFLGNFRNIGTPVRMVDVFNHMSLPDMNRVFSMSAPVFAYMNYPLLLAGQSDEQNYVCIDGVRWRATTHGDVWEEKVPDVNREVIVYATYNCSLSEEFPTVLASLLMFSMFNMPVYGMLWVSVYLSLSIWAHFKADPAVNSGWPGLHNKDVLNLLARCCFYMAVLVCGFSLLFSITSTAFSLVLGGTAQTPYWAMWFVAICRSLYPIRLVYRESRLYQCPAYDEDGAVNGVDNFRAINIQFVVRVVEGYVATYRCLSMQLPLAQWMRTAEIVVDTPANAGSGAQKWHVMKVHNTSPSNGSFEGWQDTAKYWSIAMPNSDVSFQFTPHDIATSRTRATATKAGTTPAIAARDAADLRDESPGIPNRPQVMFGALSVLSKCDIEAVYEQQRAGKISSYHLVTQKVFHAPALYNKRTGVTPGETIGDPDGMKKILRVLSRTNDALLRGVISSSDVNVETFAGGVFHRISAIQIKARQVQPKALYYDHMKTFINQCVLHLARTTGRKVTHVEGFGNTIGGVKWDLDDRIEQIKRRSQQAGVAEGNEIAGQGRPSHAETFPKREGVADGVEQTGQLLQFLYDLNTIPPKMGAVRVIAIQEKDAQLAYDLTVGGIRGLMKNFQWYGFGPPDEIKEKIMHRLGPGTHDNILWVMMTDFSKFDASQSDWCNHFYTEVCSRLMYDGSPSTEEFSEWYKTVSRVIMADFNVLARYRECVFDTENYMRSGIRSTSDRNAVLNAFAEYATLIEAGNCTPEEAFSLLGLYGGDDGVCVNTDLALKSRVCKDLGLTITVNVSLVKPLKNFSLSERELFDRCVPMKLLPVNDGKILLPDQAVCSFLGSLFKFGSAECTGATCTEYWRKLSKFMMTTHSPNGPLSEFDLAIFRLLSDYATDGHVPMFGQMLRACAYRMIVYIMETGANVEILDQINPSWYLRSVTVSTAVSLLMRLLGNCSECEGPCKERKDGVIAGGHCVYMMHLTGRYPRAVAVYSLNGRGEDGKPTHSKVPTPVRLYKYATVLNMDVTKDFVKSFTPHVNASLSYKLEKFAENNDAFSKIHDSLEPWMHENESLLWRVFGQSDYDDYCDPEVIRPWDAYPLLYDSEVRPYKAKDYTYVLETDEIIGGESCVCSTDGCNNPIYADWKDRNNAVRRKKLKDEADEEWHLPTHCRSCRNLATSTNPLHITSESPMSKYTAGVERTGVQESGQAKNLFLAVDYLLEISSYIMAQPGGHERRRGTVVVLGAGDLCSSGKFWRWLPKHFPDLTFDLVDPDMVPNPKLEEDQSNVRFFRNTALEYAAWKCSLPDTSSESYHVLSDIRTNTGEDGKPTDLDKESDQQMQMEVVRALHQCGPVRSYTLKTSYPYDVAQLTETAKYVPYDSKTNVVKPPLAPPNSSEMYFQRFFMRGEVAPDKQFVFPNNDINNQTLECWCVGDADLRSSKPHRNTNCACLDCSRVSYVLKSCGTNEALRNMLRTFLVQEGLLVQKERNITTPNQPNKSGTKCNKPNCDFILYPDEDGRYDWKTHLIGAHPHVRNNDTIEAAATASSAGPPVPAKNLPADASTNPRAKQNNPNKSSNNKTNSNNNNKKKQKANKPTAPVASTSVKSDAATLPASTAGKASSTTSAPAKGSRGKKGSLTASTPATGGGSKDLSSIKEGKQPAKESAPAEAIVDPVAESDPVIVTADQGKPA